MPFNTSLPSPPPIFPIYLLPSIRFRRRSSSSTVTTSSSQSPSTSPPDCQPNYLSGHRSQLRCMRCLSDLCLTSQIISKGFTGRHGRAYLVAPAQGTGSALNTSSPGAAQSAGNLPNTHTHKPVPRQLVTGAHTVSDISCALCGTVLGWKYVAAEDESQRYKVGKFILETEKVCRNVCWENDEDQSERTAGADIEPDRKDALQGIEFDSEDEDECEDLFTGIWSPQLASRRRKSRRFSGRSD